MRFLCDLYLSALCEKNFVICVKILGNLSEKILFTLRLNPKTPKAFYLQLNLKTPQAFKYLIKKIIQNLKYSFHLIVWNTTINFQKKLWKLFFYFLFPKFFSFIFAA